MTKLQGDENTGLCVNDVKYICVKYVLLLKNKQKITIALKGHKDMIPKR